MSNSVQTTEELIGALDARVKRREDRREFFRAAFGTVAAAGAVGLAGRAAAQTATPTPTPTASATATPTPSPTPTLTDPDILNFALNLEYLEAQFYSYAANGVGLPANLLSGSGAAGAATGGRQVAFSDPVVARYAREIAADEVAHVTFLRQQLGTAVVAQPAIDISAAGAFSAAAVAAGLIPAGGTFDPYLNDVNFLLGAFIFEDVGVSAYKGAAPLITNVTYLDAAAGILAAEGYHAGLIRTALYTRGVATPSLRDSADAISNARDTLDGATDIDQGISPTTINNAPVANIVPSDTAGIVYSRTPQQVLNIVYLNKASVSAGGFFPAGVNGTAKTSNAN